MFGKIGAAAGKNAFKVGKRVSQSETGRRATKGAITGACDGVRDDMISR